MYGRDVLSETHSGTVFVTNSVQFREPTRGRRQYIQVVVLGLRRKWTPPVGFSILALDAGDCNIPM
jgi:hypothetical protein